LGLVCWDILVDTNDAADLAPNPHRGIQCRPWMLEDHRHFFGRATYHSVSVDQSSPADCDRTLSEFDPRWKDAHHRQRGHGLSRTRFAYQTHDLASFDSETDFPQQAQGAVVDTDRQAVDLQHQ
jgi:hypothetical protein